LNSNENYYDFKNFEEDKLQLISNFIISKIKSKLPIQDTKTLEVKYQNGKKINVPVWFLQYQGHELEQIILEVFPKIKSEFSGKIKLPEIQDNISQVEKEKLKKENKIRFNKITAQMMKSKIVSKIIDNIPEFIPIELINLFKEIQDYNE
jgi:glutamate synthase domain-containing protein 1